MAKVFLTQFPISRKGSLDDLLEISKKWIIGSPHIPDVFKEQVNSLRGNWSKVDYENYSLEVRRISKGNSEFLGLKYNYPSKNESWEVTMTAESKIGLFRKTDVAIQIDYFSKPGIKSKNPKKPYLIKLILEEIEGGVDGDLEVQEKPYFLERGEEAFVADFLLGNSKNVMPIVYLSRDYDDNLLIKDPKKLAQYLSGMAHVFVEPEDKRFSFDLKEFMNGKNVFGGAIGIYWPEIHRRNYWLPEVISETSRFSQVIFQDIVKGLVAGRLRDGLTWENLQRIHVEKRIDELRKKEEKTAEDFEEIYKVCEEYEEKINELKQRLGQQVRFNQILNSKLKSREAGRDMILPEIDELYPGERLSVLRVAAETICRNTPQNSRKRRILEDFLKKNPENISRGKLKEKLRKILQKYSRFDDRLKRELEALGFRAEKAGSGHYKVYARIDNSVFSLLPTTPGGNNRSWDNSISDFLNTFF